MIGDKNSWKRQCLHADLVRLYGGFGIVYGGLLLFFFFANSGTRESGGRDLSSAIYPAIFFLIVGLGALFQKRIFAAVFSFVVGGIGIGLAIAALLQAKQSPWAIFSIPLGLLLLLPAWSTVKGWKALR